MFNFKIFTYLFLEIGNVLTTNGDITSTMVGGQRDSNNCLMGAGFTWCESTQSCLRHWETPCEDNYTDCNDCLLKQRNGENIACPFECDTVIPLCRSDEDCGDSGFCRQKTMDPEGLKECVLYSGEGDTCGGNTVPFLEERCPPSLECVSTKINIRPSVPMLAGAPGSCMPLCGENTYRDAYGSCRQLPEYQQTMTRTDGLTGIHNGQACDTECPLPPPCPSPGPDCEYTPILNECGCIVSCGDIRCNEGPLPYVCPEVMCMMYCENG